MKRSNISSSTFNIMRGLFFFIAITISHSTDALHINYCMVSLMPPQTIPFFIPFYLLLLLLLFNFYFFCSSMGLIFLVSTWFDIVYLLIIFHKLFPNYGQSISMKKSLAHRSNCAFITIYFKARFKQSSFFEWCAQMFWAPFNCQKQR